MTTLQVFTHSSQDGVSMIFKLTVEQELSPGWMDGASANMFSIEEIKKNLNFIYFQSFYCN